MVFIARRVRCMLPPCNFRIFMSYDKLSKKVRFKLAPNAMVKPVMYQTRRTYDSLLSYLETVVFPSDLCYGHKKKRHILFSCMGLSNFQWLITSNHIEEKTKLSVYMESKVWFYYYENTNATKKIIGYFIYHIWELIWKLTILLLCENILFPCNNMVLSVYKILFISHPRTTVRPSTSK